MKKISTLLTLLVLFATTITAQTTATDAPKKEFTKEEKAAMKAKKEADEAAMYKELLLTDDQIAKVKEINTEASKKSNALKADTKMTDIEKDAAKKVINDEKNAKLKVLLGDEKFKQMGTIKKRQKAAGDAAAAKPAN